MEFSFKKTCHFLLSWALRQILTHNSCTGSSSLLGSTIFTQCLHFGPRVFIFSLTKEWNTKRNEYLQKNNSKWIKELNVKAKTIKLLQENITEKLHDIGVGNYFLDMIPKAETTVKINWTSAKFKTFVYQRTIEWKGNPWNGRKYMQTNI